MWNYVKRKWLFLLVVAVLLVLNAIAWSFLWEEDAPTNKPAPTESLPDNVT